MQKRAPFFHPMIAHVALAAMFGCAVSAPTTLSAQVKTVAPDDRLPVIFSDGSKMDVPNGFGQNPQCAGKILVLLEDRETIEPNGARYRSRITRCVDKMPTEAEKRAMREEARRLGR